MEKYKTTDEFIAALSQEQKEQVTLLRNLIIKNNPELIEHIKWNSPSYILNGDDRITFSVRPKFPTALILHMGTSRPENKDGTPIMNDRSGLIQWKSDIRGVISFIDTDDIENKKSQLIQIINQWLSVDV